MGDRKELANELYDSLLYTSGAVAISMLSKKILKESMGTPENMKGTLKLAVAVAGGTVLVKYLQARKIIPLDPFN